MSLCTISIVGNLVKPPEQMYFASGRTKTTILVAVNHAGKAGKTIDATDFYRVETWGKLAELAGKYLSKGRQVGVSGRLVLDHWTDKQGRDRITPIVEATQLAFPPRLKVVTQDDQAVEPIIGANPIGGEVVFAGEEGDEMMEITEESAYGDVLVDEEDEKDTAHRRTAQSA